MGKSAIDPCLPHRDVLKKVTVLQPLSVHYLSPAHAAKELGTDEGQLISLLSLIK